MNAPLQFSRTEVRGRKAVFASQFHALTEDTTPGKSYVETADNRTSDGEFRAEKLSEVV